MGYNPTMKNPTSIGIDPSAPERCIISVPVDIEYMKAQRNTLQALLSGDTIGDPTVDVGERRLTSDERREMEHLIGFLDHFIFGIYGVVAEYPTANRNIY